MSALGSKHAVRRCEKMASNCSAKIRNTDKHIHTDAHMRVHLDWRCIIE